jgi:hypothetical protein
MRLEAILCLAAAATTATAGHLAVPLSRQSFSHHGSKVKRQQDNTDSLTLEALNNVTGGGYYSEFEIGTPPQKISFLLDTGSSDTWVNSVDADICNSVRLQTTIGYCQTQFDQNASSTYELLPDIDFNITYLDGRNIKGSYFNDTVHIGDASVRNQQLGLALESVRPTGIMGLGFSSNVAASRQYPTIVDNLVSQGFINAPVYSLYLNDLSTDAGNILFGGIDAKKFIGELATLPLVSDSGGQPGRDDITSFNVQIDGFDVQNPDGQRAVDLQDLNSYAILDSGSTISLLPNDQVQQIWDEFGVITFDQMFAPFIDCAYAGDKGDGYVFEFRFANKTIQVPMNEMVIDAYAEIQDQISSDPSLRRYFSDWDGACMFGIGSTGDFGIRTDQFTLLGATFLRSAYVVYDLANEQLAIAQANLDTEEEDITEVDAGDLPSVTGVDRQSPNNTSSTTTSEATPTSTSETGPDSTPSTTDATTSTDGTNTDSVPGATNTNADDEGASTRKSPPIAALASVAALLGMAFVLL